jgi:hypothetical protein
MRELVTNLKVAPTALLTARTATTLKPVKKLEFVVQVLTLRRAGQTHVDSLGETKREGELLAGQERRLQGRLQLTANRLRNSVRV